jgi:hypothetical protein
VTLDALLGAPPGPFIGCTLALSGAAAVATGRALALNWRPIWQVLPYALLLAVGDRFLIFALFGGPLLSVGGFILAIAYLAGVALLAHRVALVRLMIRQYPWLYDRAGPFHWRQRD